jgi:hypothetical protein
VLRATSDQNEEKNLAMRLFPKKEKKIEDKNTSLTVSKRVIEKMKYI